MSITSGDPREPEGDAVPGYWPHVRYDRPTTWREARRTTRRRAGDLRALLTRYVRRHLPPAPPEEHPPSEPPRTVGAYARLLPALRLVPWLLALVFALSFAWDFPGVTITLFGHSIPLDGLLRILSVSGLIGFITNWLAITMLFHPRRRRPLFGQGLIPAQRERVIYRLARAVSEDLINEKIIKQKIERSGLIPKYRERALQVTRGVLEDPGFRRDFKALASEYAEEVLGSEEVQRRIADFTVERLETYAGKSGLSALALRAYRFANEEDFQRRIDEAVRELPESLDDLLDELDTLLDRLPAKIEARSDEIENGLTRAVLGLVENLDVYDMVMTNMSRYDERRLEDLIKNTSNEQLNYIKYLGGILGVVGGLVIWNAPLALGVFGTAGALLYALDAALLRARRV